MSERYGGLLGSIMEAGDIAAELGVSADQAFAIQRDRAAERLKVYEDQQPAPSNIIQFRPRGC